MIGSKFLFGFTLVTGVISTVATVVTAVDQIKNGDKRAAITGEYAGRAAVDEAEKRGIVRRFQGELVNENGEII